MLLNDNVQHLLNLLRLWFDFTVFVCLFICLFVENCGGASIIYFVYLFDEESTPTIGDSLLKFLSILTMLKPADFLVQGVVCSSVLKYCGRERRKGFQENMVSKKIEFKLYRDRGDHFKVVGRKNLAKTVPLSSGKIHTLSMSSGALKYQPKQKSGRAFALPALPPTRFLLQSSLLLYFSLT